MIGATNAVMRARGANPVVCTASDQCHVAGVCNPATGLCSNPNEARRHRLQRRQRLHADRHLPGRRLHRRQPGRLHGRAISATSRASATRQRASARTRDAPTARPATTATPARRPTPARPAPAPAATRSSAPRSDQCHVAGACNPATGVCSNPNAADGTRLQRRQRLHADRHLPGRHVRGRQPGRLHGQRPVPRRRGCATRRPASAQPERARTGRRATTATPAPARTPARPAPARAARRSSPSTRPGCRSRSRSPRGPTATCGSSLRELIPGVGAVARIVPSSGTVTSFPTNAAPRTIPLVLDDIVTGPDGNLWFTGRLGPS